MNANYLNYKAMQKLFSEYGVHSEDELQKKLSDDCLTIPCVVCRREVSIDKIHFYNGDPFCPVHSK